MTGVPNVVIVQVQKKKKEPSTEWRPKKSKVDNVTIITLFIIPNPSSPLRHLLMYTCTRSDVLPSLIRLWRELYLLFFCFYAHKYIMCIIILYNLFMQFNYYHNSFMSWLRAFHFCNFVFNITHSINIIE